MLEAKSRFNSIISFFTLLNITIILIFCSIAAEAIRPVSTTRYVKSDDVPIFRNEAYSGPSRHGRGH
ncbi:hypothetical protein H5410_006559 [Solanum commersonii]|uniref:Transmembrane protein n=1 Tax=Solanum commersonii TaxID=4109 RepID=A0A9J6A9P7_SOLCO|nr:hypothetical protein H5410_006559 [Solanum commersonii]